MKAFKIYWFKILVQIQIQVCKRNHKIFYTLTEIYLFLFCFVFFFFLRLLMEIYLYRTRGISADV